MCDCDSKREVELICVDSLGVLLFIGYITPWGRTNWWPQGTLCFVPQSSQRHQGAVRQNIGGWEGGSHSGDEQVSHRITGWDELGGTWGEDVQGVLTTRQQGNMTHSFIHPLTHSHSCKNTHSEGNSGASCWPPPLQMIQG